MPDDPSWDKILDYQRGVMTLLVVLGFTALAVIIWLGYAVLWRARAETIGTPYPNRGLNQSRRPRLATLAGVTSLAAAISTSLPRETRLHPPQPGFSCPHALTSG